MPKGNPNPNQATRFQKGNKGNPKGMTSEANKLRIENAELGYFLQNKGLSSLVEAIKAMPHADIATMLTTPGVISLTKDAIDRRDGKPAQTTIVEGGENPVGLIVRTVYEGD